MGTILSATPASGTIDARQPTPLDDVSTLLGIGSAAEPITVTMSEEEANPEAFVLCESGLGTYAPNGIASVTDQGGGVFEIILERAITPGEVTKIIYADRSAVVYTAHPADVNADGVSSAVNVLALVDILNLATVPVHGLYSSDIDRSGVGNAADVLRLIDLLNGVDAFDAWSMVPLIPSDGCSHSG